MTTTLDSGFSPGTTPLLSSDSSDCLPANFSLAELSHRFNQHTLESRHHSTHPETHFAGKISCRHSGHVERTSTHHCSDYKWQQRQALSRHRSNPALSSRLSSVLDEILQDHPDYITRTPFSLSGYSSNPVSSSADVETPSALSIAAINNWPSSVNSTSPLSESSKFPNDNGLSSTTYLKTQRSYNNVKSVKPVMKGEGQRGRYVVEKNIKMRRRGKKKAE